MKPKWLVVFLIAVGVAIVVIGLLLTVVEMLFGEYSQELSICMSKGFTAAYCRSIL